MLTNRDALIQKVKIRGSLGCSHQTVVEFVVFLGKE